MDRRMIIGGAAGIIIIIVAVTMFRGQRGEVVANGQPEEATAKQLHAQASDLKKDVEIVQAKKNYQKILSEHSDYLEVEKVQDDLEHLNMQLIFSNTPVPEKSVVHEVVTGDNLGGLAKKHNTTIELIKRSNGLTSNVIRIGQKLRIWTSPFNIFVDKSQNLLTLKDGDEVVKV